MATAAVGMAPLSSAVALLTTAPRLELAASSSDWRAPEAEPVAVESSDWMRSMLVWTASEALATALEMLATAPVPVPDSDSVPVSVSVSVPVWTDAVEVTVAVVETLPLPVLASVAEDSSDSVTEAIALLMSEAMSEAASETASLAELMISETSPIAVERSPLSGMEIWAYKRDGQ